MDPAVLVAAAAQAVGAISDDDIGGWAERVRLAAAAQVVIAADMQRLGQKLADPETKIWTRRVTNVRKDKAWFFIEYEPPTESKGPDGRVTQYNEIHTDYFDQPHARTLYRIAKANIGKPCIFYQANNKDSGVTGAPAAGYREVAHLEPLAGAMAARGEAPPDRPAQQPAQRPQQQRPAQQPAPRREPPRAQPQPEPEPVYDDGEPPYGDDDSEAYDGSWDNSQAQGPLTPAPDREPDDDEPGDEPTDEYGPGPFDDLVVQLAENGVDPAVNIADTALVIEINTTWSEMWNNRLDANQKAEFTRLARTLYRSKINHVYRPVTVGDLEWFNEIAARVLATVAA